MAVAFMVPGRLAPAWAMRSAEYEARCVAMAVYPAMERALLRLVPADAEAEIAQERLISLAGQNAPAEVGDPRSWAAAGVQKLFEHVFADDVWFSTLEGVTHVVLVKKAALPEGMPLSEAVMRVHLHCVEAAVKAGLPVPDDVIEEYRANVERLMMLSPVSKEVLH